ncbi:YpuI family protein [Cohnella boryungensis]|uniref:YpuI family protein n=1 Tax=Cohnella boryungensis TaxID=768479 RepID=A0ABV8SDU2_9BACL
MPATNLKALAEASREKLKAAIDPIEQFLNHHSLEQLVQSDQADNVAFYSGLLSDLRHLLVFSEVTYEKLGAVLRRPNFDNDLAERALYEVYHKGVNSFFYPKNECYSEDGRYAYTGQDAIRFRTKPVRAARDIILGISRVYEELRDDLSYYESDYLTHRRLQGQSSK